MKTENNEAKIMYSTVHTLRSDAVNDRYKLSIWVPPNYDSSDTALPCIYVLDEPEFFGFASGVALNYFLHDDHPTPMMIVSIGKHLDSLDDWWSIRWRDFSPTAIAKEPKSGYADAFFDCLSKQIIPYIDDHYRTDKKRRILWGHSLGGLFTVYTLSKQPDLFSRYIATSPAFVVDKTELMPYRQLLQSQSLTSPKKLYVSVGDSEPKFKPYVDEFAEIMQEKNHPNLNFRYEVFAGMEHMPAALTGFINGLRWVISSE